MKRQVHITALSLPPATQLIPMGRPVKKKQGYPGSIDRRSIQSGKLHS
jgi:hypothetical protein